MMTAIFRVIHAMAWSYAQFILSVVNIIETKAARP
jgi:hypothetical protein